MHLRYLAGGRPPAGEIPHEKLYRFQFPESPGALDRFLSAISGDWNVTLFHYRSHGDDFGRVGPSVWWGGIEGCGGFGGGGGGLCVGCCLGVFERVGVVWGGVAGHGHSLAAWSLHDVRCSWGSR